MASSMRQVPPRKAGLPAAGAGVEDAVAGRTVLWDMVAIPEGASVRSAWRHLE
jgi:hypothetical protein